MLGNHENMPSPLPVEFESYKLYEVEIKYGLLQVIKYFKSKRKLINKIFQVAEGLSFLHKDVKLMHRNICPSSIVINSNGAWKLACFELSLNNCIDPNDSVIFLK